MQLILVGGFLGAGKTTAIAAALQFVQSHGHSVAVITNDQGSSLVDTGYLEQSTPVIAQITNGCFCCNYTKLDLLLREMNQAAPDYIFAEAVGSCTDMVATVVKPLQQQHKGLSTIFTVVADAEVLFRQCMKQHLFFRKEVQYIWKKQLEEADIILVSKLDLLPLEFHEPLKQFMDAAFPEKEILYQNTLQEGAVQQWLQTIRNFIPQPRMSLDIDYALYGAGEAALAWLDAELSVQGEKAGEATEKLVHDFNIKIMQNNWPVGHLKFLVDTGTEITKISYTVAENSVAVSISPSVSAAINITVNARVETEPEYLHDVFRYVINSLNDFGIKLTVKHLNYFKPGFPKPEHRVMALQ